MLKPAPHVLVMDETLEVLLLLREFLEEEGYRVTTSQAMLDVHQIAALAPDIILLEWRFRNRRDAGWRLVLSLRLEPTLRGTAVVLCTTENQPCADRQLAQVLQNLEVAVVRKPYVLDQLLGVMERAMRTPHLRVFADADGLCQLDHGAGHAGGSLQQPQSVQLFSLSQGGE